MLQREEHWIEWKKKGCNAFDKAAALSRAAGQKRRAGAVGGRAKVTKRMQLGNSELTRLWNMGGNSLEAISSTKQTVPTLTDYLRPLLEQMDPEAGVEEEYLLKHDKAFMWKAYRLMAKKDVSLLNKVSQASGGFEAAVQFMFEKQIGVAVSASIEEKLP